jgi:hypothetical protein
VGVGVVALVVAEPGEARGRAQFRELGLLLLGDAQGFVILFLSGLGMPLSTIDVSSNTRRSLGQRLALVAPETAVLGRFSRRRWMVFASILSSYRAKHE